MFFASGKKLRSTKDLISSNASKPWLASARGSRRSDYDQYSNEYSQPRAFLSAHTCHARNLFSQVKIEFAYIIIFIHHH